MKKALAVFGAIGTLSGVASAQQAVTLYGVIDLNYQYMRSGDKSPLAGSSLQRMDDGSRFGPQSRWGFIVREDLGGGLKAGAVLESGFAADTGAAGNGGRLFGRKAYLTLSSPTAGEVRFGRQFILHDEVEGLDNPFGNTTVLNPGAGAITVPKGTISLFIDAPRIDNLAMYISPTFGGFTLQAAAAPGENQVDTYHGLKGSYAGGPLKLAMSYEWSRARVGTAGVSHGGDTVNRLLTLAGNYDFGSIKVYGGYQTGRDLTTASSGIIAAPTTEGGVGTQIGTLAVPGLSSPATRLNAYTVGASMPFGVATVGVNYSRAKFENAAGASSTLGRYGIAGTYELSKRTILYTGVAFHNGDMKDFINEKRIVQLGLRHLF
jgi:predicted porin